MGPLPGTPVGEWSGLVSSETAIARSAGLAARLVETRSVRLPPALVGTALSFRSRRWWTRPPFLPLPSTDYTRWRLYTAYGDEHARPLLRDVRAFASWRRGVHRLRDLGSK